MALNDQAMLVNLSISMWEARKYDKAVSKEVETKHGATDAGRFNKLLIDKAALEDVARAVSAMRAHHYKITLPWGDNGDRLLPSKMYLQYTSDMRGFKATLVQAVNAFVAGYPALVQAARKRLGTMYNADDYPKASDVHARFGAEFSFTPVPDAKDFRVDVAAEDAAAIKASISNMVAEREKAAAKDLHARAREMVERVHERLSAEKPVIRDTLMTNLEGLVSLVKAFNQHGDPELIDLEADLRRLICRPAQLRVSATVRKNTAEAANEVLTRLKAA